jgi:hypothetical protein
MWKYLAWFIVYKYREGKGEKNKNKIKWTITSFSKRNYTKNKVDTQKSQPIDLKLEIIYLGKNYHFLVYLVDF